MLIDAGVREVYRPPRMLSLSRRAYELSNQLPSVFSGLHDPADRPASLPVRPFGQVFTLGNRLPPTQERFINRDEYPIALEWRERIIACISLATNDILI